MGLDAPGITARPLRPSRQQRIRAAKARVRAAKRAQGPAGSIEAQRAKGSKSTQAWVKQSGYKPRSKAELDRTPITRPVPKKSSGVSTSSVLLGAAKRSPLNPVRAGQALLDLPGAVRTVANTARAIGSTVYEDPRQAVRKSASSAGNLAKGLMVPVAAIPYTLAYPANRVLGNDVESPVKIGKRMVDAEATRISHTYGPSFRGDKGAYQKLRKVVKDEGPLLPALDLTTVAGPTSSLLGASARAGKLGARAARATTSRPAVRYSMTTTKDGRVRKTMIGAGVAAAHDVARRGGQRAAVARSNKRLRVRAVERVSRKPLGENSLLYADPKPLLPRRAALKPGEVTPLSNVRANRNVRHNVARVVTMGDTRARLRTQRFVTGKDGVQQAIRPVPKELRDVVGIAKQLGIRDAKGAKAILTKRLAEIDRRTDEAAAKAGPHGKRDADTAAALKGEAPERARLQELLDNPKVFERPDVQAAVARTIEIERAAVGGREGLSAERAAAGRSALVGETLGVKTATQINREARAVKDAGRAAAKGAVEKAVAERAKIRASAERVLSGARADLAKAKGRAEVLSRNVDGTNTARGTAKSPYAAGGLGVRQAQKALDEARAAVDAKLGAATDTVKAAREAHKAAIRAPLKPLRESAAAYEARVAEAAKAEGLAAPEYATTKFTEAEDNGFRVQHPRSDTAPKNPLGQKRHGTNYRLGNQAHEPETAARDLRSTVERGARIEAEQQVLAQHAIYFADKASAAKFIEGLGVKADDLAVFHSTGGVVRKDMATRAELRSSKDHGDYVAAKGVFVADKAVKQELDALSIRATDPGKILRRLAMGPQAALLALSPSWWAFQRVNDLVGMVAGGSALQSRSYGKLLRELDPDSREVATAMSGGSVSADFLTPRTGQKLGRMQRVLDENPTYRAALQSDAPATNLLIKAAHDGPTLLLRSDAKVTGAVRERQFLHNLQRLARHMDPDVKKISRGFGPLGHALKTGDVDLMSKLLKDPKYAKIRDEAAESLNRVMGDWHNYTAKEKRVKGAFAFYGFLRYSTRMAFYTLPIDHPYVGLLAAQLGAMGNEDARAIIGDDLPYGLGKLYQSNGTVAYDLARANPVTGPLTSITKPEHLVQLATPLASIMASTVMGQPIGLSDSSTGYVKQFTVKGDPNNHAVGGFASDERLRILGDQTLSLLSPYKAWKNWDARAQSSDSLAFDRRHLESESPAGQAKIDEKNATGAEGGTRGVLRSQFPLLVPSDGKNWKKAGAAATAARTAREGDEALRQAKREGALNTPLGRAKLRIGKAEARRDALYAGRTARIDAAKQRMAVARARAGLDP